jgi:hypothetical protein
MIYTQKATSPGLTFPTAWPGWGAYSSQPVTGAHPTNPGKLRTYTGRRRPGRNRSLYTPNWYYISTSTAQPQNPSPVQFDRQVQKWLTKYWTQTLTGAQRTSWASWAAAHELQTIFGKNKFLSGFGAFIQVNRAYQYGQINPGTHIPAGTAPFFKTPPTAWATLSTLTLTTPTVGVSAPGYDGYGTPVMWVYINTNWPSTASGWTLEFYFGYPGKTLSATRQGKMVFAMTVTRGSIPYFKGPKACFMYHPTLKPGMAISFAYRMWNTISPNYGLSPLTWLTLTAGTQP